jgi:hypothetical protein
LNAFFRQFLGVERLLIPGNATSAGQEVGQNSVTWNEKAFNAKKLALNAIFRKLCYFALNLRSLAFSGVRGGTTVAVFCQKILKKSSKIQILVKNPQKMTVFGQKSSKNDSFGQKSSKIIKKCE